MTLADTLQAKLAEWRPAGAGRHSWSETLPDAGWAVGLSADRADTVGCLAWELTLARTSEAPAGLTLKGWADGIAMRVGGLMEDLKVLEVDDHQQEAILRSDDPTVKGDDRLYYEVHLRGLSHATVRRFKGSRAAGTRREQVAFALTHEVLAKLVEDIAG
ncbi:MAG TPA: hypothetical protein VM533_12880 [Fimbriiglobus sp.]|jgi:hypothetical protein|nr:hypothetical protein [Fimbriiglobus sp.]